MPDPCGPLRVEPGRCIVDANDRVVLEGHRCTEDYKPSEGVLKKGLSPADTDLFVRELVARYNLAPVLIELLRTVLRETSPAASSAFIRTIDLPRIYAHIRDQLVALGIEIASTGGPAVLRIPSAPEYPGSGLPEKDVWTDAWEAGYMAAWNQPAPTNHRN